MKYIIQLLIIVFIISGCSQSKGVIEEMSPLKHDNSYFDQYTTEKEVITLIPFKEKGKWGYFDVNGDIVIKPQFDYGLYFSQGLALVKLNRKWGYINEQGEVLIPFQYKSGSLFVDGVAWVSTNDRHQLINRSGEVIKEYPLNVFDFVDDYQDGMARIELNNKYGFVDIQGNIVIQPEYVEATPFSSGRALVHVGDGKSLGINKMGEIAFDNDKYIMGAFFSEGLTKAYMNYDQTIYIDVDGNIALGPFNASGGDFSEGLASIYDYKTDRYGYIDREGIVVIKPKFDVTFKFIRGVALVEKNGLTSFINKDGEYVFEPIKIDFVDISSYNLNCDIVIVEIDGAERYMNRQNGKIIY